MFLINILVWVYQLVFYIYKYVSQISNISYFLGENSFQLASPQTANKLKSNSK